ncbi:MAG: helix-turn-helix domain-containing protein [Oscillospiraceae bacterium]|nr:helix-turn-helix domain-containing protein [Oscillospiraceae bacterium]
MDSIQLGKKLKEARLTKKMTQSDVVGTFITRNMLSQIESGAASPSLRTLEYLANTLEIPVHYLVSELDDADAPSAVSEELLLPPVTGNSAAAAVEGGNVFLKCKSAYMNGDYAAVIEHASDLDSQNGLFSDEGAALLARAYLKTAVRLMKDGKYKSAIAHARLAARYGEVGIYASREIRTEALLLLDELSEMAN